MRVLLTIVFITLLTCAKPGVSAISFYHYGITTGLTEPRILSITQDSVGFIWLAGEHNLTRFDGHQFVMYHNSGKISQPWNQIYTTFTDNDGRLWVGSDSGCSFYSFWEDRFVNPFPELDNFGVYSFASAADSIWMATTRGLAVYNKTHNKLSWFPGNAALDNYYDTQAMCLDNSGNIWFIKNNSLYFADTEKNTIEAIKKLAQVDISALFVSHLSYSNGLLFLGTAENGLFKFDLKSGGSKNFILDYDSNWIHHFSHEDDTIMWLGTNSGLYRLNHETGKYIQHTNMESDPLSMERTTTRHIFVDRQKNLWLSSGFRGIDFGINNSNFSHLMFSADEPYNLTQQELSSIDFDRTGNLWTGYESGLLEEHYSYPPYIKVNYFLQEPGVFDNAGSVFKVFEDSNNRIWAGGWKTGLQQLNISTRVFSPAEIKPKELNAILSTADVRDIGEDPDKTIWFSAHGLGLVKYDPVSKNASLIALNEDDPQNGLSDNYIYNFCIDSANNIWVASSYGLNKYNPKTDKFSHFVHNPADSLTISGNMVNVVFCDELGTVWAGTTSGLNVYLPDKNVVVPVKTAHDYRFNNISAIESVIPGEIWASTKSGIFKLSYSTPIDFTTLNFEIHYWFQSNGLISNVYFDRVSAANATNNIYFGGNEGVDYLNPVLDQYNPPEVSSPVIISITVYDEKIVPQLTVDNQAEVILHPHQKLVSFRFTAVDFLNAGQQKYRYKLDGFDKQWVYPEREMAATFTNLKPGDYTFEVEVKNKDGNWVGEKNNSIKLEVKKPFWKTWVFIVFALISTLFLIYLLLKLRDRRIHKKQAELEKLVLERTQELAKKNEELLVANQTKNKFFSIISHDLRSPFSGLLGILDLLNDPDNLGEEEKNKFIQTARNSANNIFHLLENLLTWSRSQNNTIGFNPEKFNLSNVLKKNVELAKDLAGQKAITIEQKYADNINVFGDPNMIDTVVRNLLANAVKFTEDNGKVTVWAEEKNKHSVLRIEDTGIGIKADQKKYLFDIKTKSNPGTSGESGTGLGLVITKEFVNRNNGKLEIKDNHPKGTIFEVTIPNKK